MHALPLALSLVVAAAMARPLLGLLSRSGSVRANFRGRSLPCPLGLLLPAAGLAALAPLLLLQRLGEVGVLYPEAGPLVTLVLAAGLLGLADDRFGAAAPRGLRAHAHELSRGRLTTGALKALGVACAALLVASPLVGHGSAHWLLAAGVLTLSVHVFNLLDLRPGRAAKALVLLGAGLTLGARQLRPLLTVGLFLGPALVAGFLDVRERAMLGDAGAAAVGAVAGLWIVLTLDATGQLVALAALLALAVYGEMRSISALVERTPGLRHLDSFGRPS